MKLYFEKIHFFWLKLTNFFLSAQNASICIRMHQNVCRMNCANVFCKKISKKWFWLHSNRLKLMNYFLHFVFADPVCQKAYSQCTFLWGKLGWKIMNLCRLFRIGVLSNDFDSLSTLHKKQIHKKEHHQFTS